MGTGCVFNRTALYGYEPPIKPKPKKKGILSSCFGGSRKKSSKKDSKKKSKHADPTVPIFNLEDIEEGVEGMLICSFILFPVNECSIHKICTFFFLHYCLGKNGLSFCDALYIVKSLGCYYLLVRSSGMAIVYFLALLLEHSSAEDVYFINFPIPLYL